MSSTTRIIAEHLVPKLLAANLAAHPLRKETAVPVAPAREVLYTNPVHSDFMQTTMNPHNELIVALSA